MDDETLNHSPPSHTAGDPTVLSVETNGRPGSTGSLGGEEGESHGGQTGLTGNTGDGSQQLAEELSDQENQDPASLRKKQPSLLFALSGRMSDAVKEAERRSDRGQIVHLIETLRELHGRSKDLTKSKRSIWKDGARKSGPD